MTKISPVDFGGVRELIGEQEAHVIALACGTPPDGRREWTMHLLADKIVALGMATTISDETIRQTLKAGHQTGAAQALVHPRGERRIRLAD